MTLSGAYLAFVWVMVLLLSSISMFVIVLNASMNREWPTTLEAGAALPTTRTVDVIRFAPAPRKPPAAALPQPHDQVECTGDGLRTVSSPCCRARLSLCSQLWSRRVEGVLTWRDWCPTCWEPYQLTLGQTAGRWTARWTAVTA